MSLTMEKVAAEIEYAKGTVYQHFSCKEELLCALCLRHFELMKSMFCKAVSFQGKNRFRMVAVLVAYQLFFKLHNRQFMQMKTINSIQIRHKVSEQTQQQLKDAELECHQVIGGVVAAAISSGELDLQGMGLHEFLFGLWSSAFGGMMLQATDIPMAELGIPDPMAAMRYHMTKTLDGYGWSPLSSQYNIDDIYREIEETVFKEEILLLESRIN